MHIVEFITYFPSYTAMNKDQKRSYKYVVKNIKKGRYIDVGDNISYIFLYIYEIMENVKTIKDIKLTIEKLKAIQKLYEKNDKINDYLNVWIGDLFFINGNYNETLKYYNICRAIDGNSILNIKYKLGIDINAKELLSLRSDRKFTSFVKDKYDSVEKYCNIILKKEKEYRKMDYIQYIAKKYPQEAKYNICNWCLFAGLPCGYNLRKLNPKVTNFFEETFCFYSIQEVYDFVKTLSREAENLLREDIGVPKVGEGWIGETELYYKIRTFLPNLEVIHNFRSQWLGKQHLDIFITKISVAFEYQRDQHFKPIEHFGGKKAFEENVKRDKLKQTKCKKNNVNLYYVLPDYNFDDIKKILSKYI